MINAEKIVLETQTYYTPSWSGVEAVKILEVLPNNRVLVKAGKDTFTRSLAHMYNTDQAAKTGRRAWEDAKRKSRKKR